MGYFAVTMSDGSVRIMQTIGSADPALEVGKWVGQTVTVTSIVAIGPSSIPDGAYWSAVTFDGAKFAWDMVKARAIHRDRLRQQRGPLVAALMQGYLRADAAGDTVAKTKAGAAIVALHNAVSDPSIDAATDTAQLAAITLASLAPAAVAAASNEIAS